MIGPSSWGNCGALGGTRTPNLLIRRSRHIVQDRPSRSVCWADIPELSARDRRCLAAWQQYWQQSCWNSTSPRPSAFQADIFQVGADRASVKMLPPDAAGSQWVLVLLSLLLSAADEPQRAPIGLAALLAAAVGAAPGCLKEAGMPIGSTLAVIIYPAP
jgi:hypothetical protein